MKLNFNIPINSTSFGQTSLLIARTLFSEIKKGKRSDSDYSISPLGAVDLSTQDLDDEFTSWLSQKIATPMLSHDRKTPSFKLWHLNGALESMSEKQTLLSFYELDQPTKAEINSVKNNNKLFSSQFSIDAFKPFGQQAQLLPLAFDSYNFNNTGKAYFSDGRITFNLCGKFEKRKNHEKIIKAWIKRYKNSRSHFLQCAVYNPFLSQETNNALINNSLTGDKPFNVTFLPFLGKNSQYNDFLNSADVVIGMSGGEGWGLPEFTSVCLGKHSVIMNSHGYKLWAEHGGCNLVNPSSKIECYDGIFFQKNAPFNQGNIFDFNEDEFINACEAASSNASKNKVNKKGLELREIFSKEKLLDNIINYAS